MEHADSIQQAISALEAQVATLKSLLGHGPAMMEETDEPDEDEEAAPPPHESSQGRRARHREKASRVIRREMTKGKEQDYALD